MKRMTALYALLICTVAVLTSPVNAQALFGQTSIAQETAAPRWQPDLILPSDTAYRLCTGDSACFVVRGSDADAGDSLTLSLLSGPITFAPRMFGNSFSTDVCFTPTASGDYRFIFQLMDKSGRKDVDTVLFTITYNQPPHIDDQYYSVQQCYEYARRNIMVVASDPDGDVLSFRLLSGPGVIESSNGLLQYVPSAPGIYQFAVEVADKCATDTAIITDTLTLNQKPYFAWTDTTINLCVLEEVCVDLLGIDPEHGPMEIRLEQGDGTIRKTSDSTAELCFMPGDVDSATYTFIVCVADLCPYETVQEASVWPRCFPDTLHITVIINRPPVLACPPEIVFNDCQVEDNCFDISATDPDGDPLTYAILSGNATINGTTVCVTDTADSALVVVEVTDDCGNADTCSIPVKLGQAHPPYVTLPDDFAISVCQAEQICIDAFADDPDFDIATVIANFGNYDPNRNRICFTADTTGLYEIILTATDQCGLMDADTVYISVSVNEAPFVQFGSDLDSALCAYAELCFDVTVTDDNLANVWVSHGTYNAQTGQVCFTPTTSGEYVVVLRATDDCEAIAEDTLRVRVAINNPPIITGLPDTTLYLCNPQYVCLPFDVSDPEGNIQSITVNRGQIKDGSACFVPYSQGTYPIIVTVIDSCGLQDVDTAIVTVRTDQEIILTCPNDTSIFLCEPDTLCFPVGGVPADAQVRVIGTAAYWDASKQAICFFSECCLENVIRFEVTSACGTVKTCEFTVTIKTNTAPVVLLPRDTSVVQCAPGQICLPVSITDYEDNLVSVVATGGTYDKARGVICIDANQSGSFTVAITATDECGAVGTDQMTINVSANQPPMVGFGEVDTLLEQCEPTEICLPVIISDINGNISSITTSLGQYDATRQAICFTPTESGRYCVQVIVFDSCNVADTANVCVTVISGGYVSLTCPPPPELQTICAPDTLCFEIGVEGTPLSMYALGGYVQGTTVCVPFDTTGTYIVKVIAEGSCNSDTCEIIIPVERLEVVNVTCPGNDTSLFACELPDTIAIPASVTGTIASLNVLPMGAYYDNGFIYVPVFEPGQFVVGLVAENACGKDSCSIDLTVTENHPPLIAGSPDTTILLCGDTGYVAFTYSVSDPDNNIVEITSSLGVIENDLIIFQPTAPGAYSIILTATDACSVSSVDTVVVTVETKPSVDVVCPDKPYVVAVDIPDTVRVPLVITPANSPVQILPDGYYDWTTGEAVVYITSMGTFNYTAIVTGECNVDTCEFSIEVGQYQPPVVECVGSFDTLLCVVEPDTICLPVTITGSNVSVTVSPYGYYADGSICLPIDAAGEYTMMIIASNERAADTCYSTVVVRENHDPIVALPDPYTAEICPLGTICFDADYSDIDNNVASVYVNLGQPVFQGGKMQYCFAPDTAGVYRIIASATDSCGKADYDTTFVTVQFDERPIVDLGDGFATLICEGEVICLPLTVTDNNLDTITVTGGTYDSNTGQVCFVATEAGSYQIIARAIDSCGNSEADTAWVTVTLNQPPMATLGPDTSLYICIPHEVCVPLTIYDPDNNIQSVSTNRGEIKNGTVCFVPYGQGTFPIIVTVTDSCGLQDVDTAVVTVRTDQEIVLTCPNDTSIFLCEPDTLCFPVGGVPADAQVRVIGTSAYWDAAKQSVCFYSECCLENTIRLEITSACGTVYTCQFTVKVKTNTSPVVLLPKDTTIIQCAPGQICLPVSITDYENNLVNVAVSGGTYDAARGVVCFTPGTSGRATIIVSATDACGAFGTDQIVVTTRENTGPIITYTPGDTLFTQCTFEEICLPVTITDLDDNLTSVTASGGTYNAATGKVCFLPTDTGRHCISIVAIDQCGIKDSIQACVRVKSGGIADIICNSVPPVNICKPQQVCVPIAITGYDYTVSTSLGSYSGGQLCFQADTSGTYVIRVIANAACGSDTCDVSIPVQIQPPVEFTVCPGNQTVQVCSPDTVCFDFAVSSSATNVRVNSAGYLNGNQVCVPVTMAGTKVVRLIAEGPCGVDTCVFNVTTVFNSAPVVTARDTVLTVCTLSEICVPFSATDVNNNLQSVTASLGVVKDNSVCFTPASFGIHNITITATDSCGLTAQTTIKVTVNLGASASIVCPEGDQFASLCKPDSVYIVMPISPANATVTVTPNGRYNPATGKLAIWVATGGTYQVTVIATAQCGADTCAFTLKATMGEPPAITCPGNIDTLLCLVTPDTLCFPVTVTGTGVQVTVAPAGYYQAGYVCVPVTQAGSFWVKLTATGSCGTAQCSTLVEVTADQMPVLTLPVIADFERCPDDTNTICIEGIGASDAENPVVVTKICGPGELIQVGSGYKLCFKPTTIAPEKFCIQVTDGCHTLVDTLDVNIVLKPDCDVCALVSIDGGACTPVGLRKNVDIRIKANDPIGGFNLLISYDPSALTFLVATINGTDIEGWEYFNYTLNSGNCGSSCPPGLVRLVGIAETNNGAKHPPDSTYLPDGVLVRMEFQVANNQNLGDQFVPISFIWYDCGDNSISDKTGNILFVDRRIYNAQGILIWDEDNDALYPDAARYFTQGVPDACVNTPGSKGIPLRCIDFVNGGVCIIHPDSIDDRGDINLNGVAYEIGDAVLFSRYFVYGLGVFTIDPDGPGGIPAGAGQIAATDVNADGLTLTVADLTTLIRVVVGQIPPIPKLVPYPERLFVAAEKSGSTISISTEAISDIGAAHFVCRLSPDMQIGEPRLLSGAEGMQILYSVENGVLKMLVFEIGEARIESGIQNIIEIPYSGDGELVIQKAEICDYYGRPYVSVAKNAGVPESFSLAQNYPNPFNPSTTISFSLPAAATWKLSVFNVTGSLVREFTGASDAGMVDVVWSGTSETGEAVASGLYFYRLEAAGMSQTRKMMLLK